MGVLGFSGHEQAKRAVADRDLVIAFGATFDELSTNSWTALPRVPIVSVDCHCEHAARLPNTQPVVAMLDDVVSTIASSLERRGVSLHPSKVSLHSMNPPRETPGPVHPAALMAWLSAELPEDVVVHVDTGTGFSWSTRHMKRRRPNTYRVAMGLGSMGWAIGAVIGAAVASGRRCVCVCGDGAMLMSSLELTVAVAEGLPVTYIVLNDSGLGMVRHGQSLSGSESIAHEIPTVRFDQLARACGAEGYLVESSAALCSLPRSAVADDSSGPCVLDIRVDRNAVPPILDRIRALGSST
jgi:acetolactate synthase-1/2/3 large subunit